MIFSQIYKIVNVFGTKEKKDLTFLFMLIFLSMFMEVFSIGLIIPVMMSILNKDLASVFPFIHPILDFFGNPSQRNMIILTSLILVCFYFLKNMFLLFFLSVEGKCLSNIDRIVKSKLFKLYISQKHYNSFKSNTSKFVSNISQDCGIFNSAVRCFLVLTAEVFVALGILALLIIIEPTMMLLNLFIVMVGMFFFNFFTKHKLERMSDERKKFTDNLFLTLNNSFNFIKEINVFGKNLFDKDNNEIYKIAKNFHVYQGLPKIFYEAVGVLMLMTLIVIMALTFRSYDNMISFLAIAGASAFRLIPSANRILTSLQYLGYAEKSTELISDEINKSEIEQTNSDKDFVFKKDIVFKNVSFKYDSRKNFILKNINFSLKKPDKILIYGETGVGKSTFIEILLGLLKPTSGKVEVEEKDVNLNFKNWAKLIGYVPQKVSLVDGSILSNIAFGVNKSEINKKLLSNAIRVAALDSFIRKLPSGLDTLVGESGSKLSGGQIQRIGIARATYRNPEILIFDEATNALDEETENKVVSNILNNFKDKILVFISHNKNLSNEIEKKYKIENLNFVAI